MEDNRLPGAFVKVGEVCAVGYPVDCMDESPIRQLAALTHDRVQAYIREQDIELTDFSRL